MKRVIVVGAGASGMMAAITAAKNGAAVTVVDAMDRAGKKILLTGNGRCNLTHVDERPEESCFGAERVWIREVMRHLMPEDVRRFFLELGLPTFEKNGYVYPVTGQSSSVTAVLTSEMRRLKIKLKLSEKILALEKDGTIWKVRTDSWCYEGDAVILACGSKAAPRTGSDGSGYELAKMAGHRIRAVQPALTPVLCEGDFFQAVAGVRCRATVSLYRVTKKEPRKGPGRESEKESGRKPEEKRLIRRESGELLWTGYGVSGILVFQLSRFISTSSSPEKELILEADLLPDLSEEDLAGILRMKAKALGQEKLPALLAGFLNEKLIPVILKRAGMTKKNSCEEMAGDRELLGRLVWSIKHFRLIPRGTKSFDTCQVCAGGVDTAQVDCRTLESGLQSGLYFAGEILDVDGLCGGYNLQWAWASGYTAGRAAAQSGSAKIS